MSSRSLLLVMLVLVCLQSCTEAQNGNGPSLCCFTYQSSAIPSKQVEVYKKTQAGCTKPGTM
ncbi:hypothetical protein C0J50_11215 [Silurus asotus]|uniref:Chemokine interleukin-8-like domain-containing protein n=1 Tax=Silurus asotus TaxID=30991 RepID=A0AAD5FFQ2_SILAS|nr:hypothetical protein C0J50_11215 [Silurus asotus]